jgi:hypothetical protein
MRRQAYAVKRITIAFERVEESVLCTSSGIEWGANGPEPASNDASAALLLLVGCATSHQGLKTKRGSGTSQSFPGTTENAWRACLVALHELDLELKELDPERRYVLADHGSSAWSVGEHIGCFVQEDTLPGRQSIEVVSQRVMATNAFAKNWSEDALWMIGVHMSRLEAAVPGLWLHASQVDVCVEQGLEVTRQANLELTREERQRCRKDANGSSEDEAACLAERERVQEGWIVYADPGTVAACLDGQPADGRTGGSTLDPGLTWRPQLATTESRIVLPEALRLKAGR